MPEFSKKSSSLDLREIGVRTTLRHFRLRGHIYVDLRRVGKRSIFFCTLCQVQCFNDSVLSDHLNGNLHSRRFAAAKVALLGPNPWPYSDGVFFFTNPRDSDGLTLTCANGSNGRNDDSKIRFIPGVLIGEEVSKLRDDSKIRFIPGVLIGEEVSKLRVSFMGYGHIGSKVQETVGGHCVPKIWCAWLGQGNSDGFKDLMSSPKCDYAVVTFPYSFGLGRKPTADELEVAAISSGLFFEVDDMGKRRKRRKKSFSDPEDSVGTNGVDGSNGVQNSGHVSQRAARRELRKVKFMAAERTCDICRQPMLTGKDVSSLLNYKTGRLFCSSRNSNGAFHLFHTSCLIHWILQCEYEMWVNGPAKPKIVTRGRKAKSAQNNKVISSVFCPECQGTGIHIEGEEFEKATVILPKMFLYKLEAIKARNTWMKNPEDLHTCSTGLQFEPDASEKFQGKEALGKLLHFYRADE